MLQYACSALSTTADFFAYDSNCCLDADDPDDVETAAAAIDMASDMLSILSAGRVSGRCTKIVHPFGYHGGCFIPMDRDGLGFGSGADFYARPLAGYSAIPLRGPNPEVVEVRIGGTAVPPSAYRLIRFDGIDFAIRIDGEVWPATNSFDASDASSWTVTQRFGFTPDKITRDATNELAGELAKDFTQRDTLLPPGIKNINLQGVSATLEDEAEALRDGHENMPAVARFLGIYNPDGERAVSGIWSPELTGGWRLYEVLGPSGS